jgi:hypothetical protein
MPRPGAPAETYEGSLTGGEVFSMYCNQCHIARPLAERPFLNYENVMAHMRARANITGQEYARLIEFLERFHDVPSASPPVEATPRRFFFSRPIAELREEKQAGERAGQDAAEGGGNAPANAPGAGADLPPAIP